MLRISLTICLFSTAAAAQSPPNIDLNSALTRARQYGGLVQPANAALALAKEDRVQARAAALPQVSALSQYIYTQPNGTPSGVFVSNDGPHVYNDQGVVHEDLMPLILKGEQRRAAAAEATARAKVDMAMRGLNATVIQNYYAIANAQRKLNNAALSLSEARQFLDITQKQEAGGEVAHADVVKAQIQMQQRRVDLNEAQTTVAKAKIALGVLIFPDPAADFTISDDLDQVDAAPAATATVESPDVKAASAAVTQAGLEAQVARYGYLPTITFDYFYGINSNQFAVHNPDGNLLLGNAAMITATIPVWNWGATRSKIRQAEIRQEQARQDLALAQRQLQGGIAAARAELDGAGAQVTLLRDSQTFAEQSLRLTLLRYQAGEATAFEVADAQSTLKTARDAYDDGLARYRIATASLRSLMGTL